MAGGIGPSLALQAGVTTQTRGTTVNRRDFLRGLALLGAAPLAGVAPTRTSGLRLPIAVGYPAIDPLFEKGYDLGISEASRSAALFSIEVHSHKAWLDAGLPLTDLVAGLGANRVAALVTCCDDAMTQNIAHACAGSGIIHLNCGSRSDDLRRKFCRGGTLHIEASGAMYSGARSLVEPVRSIELWDAKLERYGAAQLNDRFKAFARTGMNGSAWAGWFSVKIILESFLRGSGNVGRWIASDTAQFDGHKGAPLSFRRWDGQLRQPLYAAGTRIIDVPDTSRSSRPAREILDTIGDGPEVNACPRGVPP